MTVPPLMVTLPPYPIWHVPIPTLSTARGLPSGKADVYKRQVVGGVDAVGDGDEAHPIGREYPAQIPAGFNVLAPQPGEVFYNDAVDISIGDILHHFLECGTVKDDAAVSIVDLFGNDLNIRVALYKVFNELALIGNAVALAGMIVGVGQADVSGSFCLLYTSRCV